MLQRLYKSRIAQRLSVKLLPFWEVPQRYGIVSPYEPPSHSYTPNISIAVNLLIVSTIMRFSVLTTVGLVVVHSIAYAAPVMYVWLPLRSITSTHIHYQGFTSVGD